MVGAALTTASAVLILTLAGLSLAGFEGGPYDGILTAVLLPILFVLGLVLIPIGAWWDRRRNRGAAFPIIDLNQDRVRQAALLVLALTVVNLAILAVGSFKAVEVVESTSFCGETCHTVMNPQYTAYRRSPHANVPCVECHVGSGAESFVEAKLSGTRQLVHVIRGVYPRPVPAPVETLRPANETCGACHTPGRRIGDRLKVITKFADDETNTETKTVLMMKVDAIHWHADPKNALLFRSDPKREKVEEIVLAGAHTGGRDGWRSMDCTDCHNRTGHAFGTAAREVDAALLDGRIDKTLPFVKREAMKALTATYASAGEAREKIPAQLRTFYETAYSGRAAELAPAVAKAGEAIVALHAANVFPEMKVDWGTYPSQRGHEDFPGCFRCHDEEHKVGDRTVAQDCALCHDLLANEEENPAILTQLKP